MSLFDLAAGLVLLVSALVGWIRGGTREVAAFAALIVAAVVAFFALRFTGPIARHAIHTAWVANLVAVLCVFAVVYVLLRVLASSLTRRIHQTSGLGGLDRLVGGGIGVVRALVVLGLANLIIMAVTPADRMPTWMTQAMLWPASVASAQALKAFAPHGADLAHELGPAMSNAIASDSDAATNDAGPNKPRELQVERTP